MGVLIFNSRKSRTRTRTLYLNNNAIAALDYSQIGIFEDGVKVRTSVNLVVVSTAGSSELLIENEECDAERLEEIEGQLTQISSLLEGKIEKVDARLIQDSNEQPSEVSSDSDEPPADQENSKGTPFTGSTASPPDVPPLPKKAPKAASRSAASK